MKKLVFLFAILLGFTVAAYSQTVQAPVTADQKADQVVSKLKDNLSLSDEQVTNIKGITLNRIAKVTDARKKYGADKQRVQSASKLAYDEWENQLKGILTTEQYNKFIETKNQY
ncbi:MAG TPA: hypothetical protein VNB90_00180 [Cytophagaceae bacterium]|jgi:predicted S18 family serine protease|nr:hypothetical protein [Cytophagaceae bacterium]